jgi:hypothetical protein
MDDALTSLGANRVYDIRRGCAKLLHLLASLSAVDILASSTEVGLNYNEIPTSGEVESLQMLFCVENEQTKKFVDEKPCLAELAEISVRRPSAISRTPLLLVSRRVVTK